MARSIWDILAWVAFGIVVLYFLLKALGILKSPIAIDIVTIVSAAYFVGKFAQKIDEVSNDIDCHTQKIDKISNDIEDIKEDVKELGRNSLPVMNFY